MAVLDWIKNRRERKKSLDAREANTEKENQLLELAQERFEIARSAKTDPQGRNLHDKWKELDKVYRGDQWTGSIPEYRSKPVLNFTFSLVESVVPRLTDNRPEILVMEREDPKNARLAEMLSTTQSYLWYINRMQRQMPEAVRMCMKYGTIIFKAIWDPDMTYGAGDVAYSIVHPMNFFNDPRAYTIEQMDYCFVRMPKSMEYYHRRWPEKGQYVVPDMDWVDTEQIEGADQPSQEETATLTEYWFRDENGDLCLMYYSGHVVLEVMGGEYDGTNEPVYRHNKFPFSKMVDYPADKEFWGIGEVELILLLQRLINNFESQIIDNTRLMSNAQWVVNKVTSGLTEEDAWVLNSRPGSVIFTHDGGVERMPGAPIPPHIPEHQERLIFAMEQILGIHDVVQGRQPTGVRAASAIIALQESANVRVRQKSRNLEFAIQDLADMANWLVLEYYEEARQMRVTGKTAPTTLDVREALEERMLDIAAEEGMAVEVPGLEGYDTEIEPEEGMVEAEEFEQLQAETPPLEEYPIGPMNMGVPPGELGAMEPQSPMGLPITPDMTPEMLPPGAMDEIMDELRFPEFDVEVKVGPSVPYSQALLYEQAKEFYQLGIIDRQAVLDVTGFPNKEEILARMEGREAAEAAGEAERVGERTFGEGLPGMPPGTPL